jgi:hypothetical protein
MAGRGASRIRANAAFEAWRVASFSAAGVALIERGRPWALFAADWGTDSADPAGDSGGDWGEVPCAPMISTGRDHPRDPRCPAARFAQSPRAVID